MQPNFSMVRGRTGATSHSRKINKVSMWFNNRHTLGSYHHLNQSDSEGQTPSLIGHGPDIPVRVLLQLDRERGE